MATQVRSRAVKHSMKVRILHREPVLRGRQNLSDPFPIAFWCRAADPPHMECLMNNFGREDVATYGLWLDVMDQILGEFNRQTHSTPFLALPQAPDRPHRTL
jgi:hypothetical protein